MKHTTPILIAVLAAVALAGCASAAPVSTAPAGTGGELPTAAATAAGSTSGAPTAATPSSTPTAAFPAGEPPRPGAQDQYPKSDTVPGLTAAIAAAQHPGLQICEGFESLVTASGDLRGDGGEQYLVDTTCTLATASSPDEVALYDVHGGTIARSAVLSEFTANRPKPSSYPYLWKEHTVVLAYDQGTRYRLIQLTPDSVVPGVVQAFH